MSDNLERNPKNVKSNAELINQTYLRYKEVYETKLEEFTKQLEAIRKLRESLDTSNFPERIATPINTVCACSIAVSKENIAIVKEMLNLLEMANESAQDVIRLGKFEVDLNKENK